MMNDHDPAPPEGWFQPLGLRQLVEHLVAAMHRTNGSEASTAANETQGLPSQDPASPNAE
jgi:hypothetical protein